MNYKRNNIKQRCYTFGKKVQQYYLALSIPKQAVIFGTCLGIISLFLPWIIDTEKNLSKNAFAPISGNIGFILIIIYITLLFLLFGSQYKEKLRLYSDLNYKTYMVILIASFISILASIIGLSFAMGLEIYGQFTGYGNGIIFSTIAGIIIFVGGYFLRKEYKKINTEIILEKLSENREKKKEQDNMKLPF